jgi:hypothetical protein
MRTAPLSNIKLTPKQTVIAFVFIALILTSLGLRLYFSNQAMEFSGPRFTVANDHTVLTVYHTSLYRMDNQGNIRQRIALRDIGIKDRVADIQLLDDQRFVIGDWDNQRVLLCSFTGPDCHALIQNLGSEIRNFLKFDYREAENALWIADTDQHRILRYDLENHTLQQISAPKQLLFPNHLRLESDGLLYVTDTNHHRIAAFELRSGQPVALKKQYRVSRELSHKRFPIFFYRMTDGDMYLLQANNRLQFADLVWLPAHGAAQKLTIPARADIGDISRMGQTLLLSDAKRFAIYAMDITDHGIFEFGGAEIRGLFARDRGLVRRFTNTASAMFLTMIALIVAMIGFITYLIIQGKQALADAESDLLVPSLPPLIPGQLTWVQGNAKLQRLVPVLGLLTIVCVSLMYALLRMTKLDLLQATPGSREQAIAYLYLSLGVFFVMAVVNAVLNLYTRIGSDGMYIYIDRLFKTYKIDPRDMLYSEHYLMAKNLIIPYRNILKQYFRHAKQFEAYITPLLNAHARKVRTFRDVPFYMLRHPTWMGLFNTASLILMCYLLYRAMQIEFVLRGA